MIDLYLDPDIRKSTTLPAAFYKDPEIFERSKEKIFLRSWHFAGDDRDLQFEGQVKPLTLGEGLLNEPVLISRTENGQLYALSNVCTHRGNILVEHPCKVKHLKCAYHGRRFSLSGKFESMPEFEDVHQFPSDEEDLPKLKLQPWSPFLFLGIKPAFELAGVIKKMEERVGWLPLDKFRYSPERSREYLVNAHWALYCDNFLEGFHIPFVHAGLNQAIDFGSYETLLFDHGSLQIGYGSGGTHVFDLPPDSPDHGKDVAAYYYWIYPNMMFNFYPWGLSINIVQPLAKDRTKVSFLTYLYDISKMENSAGAMLDKVEREDEWVVENVQKGINSGLYKRGRFSPNREQGVHHFHLILSKAMTEDRAL